MNVTQAIKPLGVDFCFANFKHKPSVSTRLHAVNVKWCGIWWPNDSREGPTGRESATSTGSEWGPWQKRHEVPTYWRAPDWVLFRLPMSYTKYNIFNERA